MSRYSFFFCLRNKYEQIKFYFPEKEMESIHNTQYTDLYKTTDFENSNERAWVIEFMEIETDLTLEWIQQKVFEAGILDEVEAFCIFRNTKLVCIYLSNTKHISFWKNFPHIQVRGILTDCPNPQTLEDFSKKQKFEYIKYMGSPSDYNNESNISQNSCDLTSNLTNEPIQQIPTQQIDYFTVKLIEKSTPELFPVIDRLTRECCLNGESFRTLVDKCFVYDPQSYLITDYLRMKWIECRREQNLDD